MPLDKYLSHQINELERTVQQLTRPRSGAELDALGQAQRRADETYSLFGTKASAPTIGETELAYRKRLVREFLPVSRFKGSSLYSLDSATFPVVEEQIYADAAAVSRDSANHQVGTLTPYEERDATGRLITKYHGDPTAWMSAFMQNGAVCKINRGND